MFMQEDLTKALRSCMRQISGDIDEENNQAVDSDMDDPSSNPAVTEGLAAV